MKRSTILESTWEFHSTTDVSVEDYYFLIYVGSWLVKSILTYRVIAIMWNVQTQY